MNRGALRWLVGALAVGVFCAPGHAAPKKAPQKDLTELRARINQLKREIDSAEENKADVLDELKESEQAISQINRGLHELAEERRDVAHTLNDAQQQSKQTRTRIQVQQTLLSKLLYQHYVNGSQETLRLLLNLQNPHEIARQIAYYGYLSRSRATLITDLRHDLKSAEAAENVVKEKHGELAQIEGQQLSEKRALQKQADIRKRTLSQLERQIAARQLQVAQLQRDEKRLTDLVERLARARASAKTPPRKPRVPPDIASNRLPKFRGQFQLPVAGELSNRFGSRRSDTGTNWKGLFIRANAGSPVKALESGLVVFADWLRGFGNLIIIDHGDGYMSLYGSNEALLKQEGETVASGDQIAKVGNSGGNAETGLYFEVRYHSRAIDPLQWVSKH